MLKNAPQAVILVVVVANDAVGAVERKNLTRTHGWKRPWVFCYPGRTATTETHMSKTTESTKAKPAKTSARPRAEVGPAMFGRDIFVEALEREDGRSFSPIPGGASMEIHQSLTHSKIRTILPRHEQGGSFAAEGYAARAGKAGVCMGTSGRARPTSSPPSTDAFMDSCPLIAITGQVTQAMIGRGAFQETDHDRRDAAHREAQAISSRTSTTFRAS